MKHYEEINLESIPKGAVFQYVSKRGEILKCRKLTGPQSFSWKEGPWTFKRYQRFPDDWYCVRTIQKRKGAH